MLSHRRRFEHSFGLHGQLQTFLVDHRFVSRRLDCACGIDCHRLDSFHGSCSLRQYFATGHTNLVRPCGHRGQRRRRIGCCDFSQLQSFTEGCPHGLHLLRAGLQGRRELRIHARPLGICRQSLGLGHPTVKVSLQGFTLGQGVLPWLGREHFNALRQQHGSFTLHLGLMLQIFNGFHALSQGRF